MTREESQKVFHKIMNSYDISIVKLQPNEFYYRVWVPEFYIVYSLEYSGIEFHNWTSRKFNQDSIVRVSLNESHISILIK